jgi:hypothetical protein
MSAVTVPNLDLRRKLCPRIIPIAVGTIVILGALFNAAVGALSLFSPTGFLALVGERSQDLTPGVMVFAGYAAARELAIAAALLVLLAVRATPALVGVLVFAALANVFDTAGALLAGRWVQLPGAVIFSVAYASAAIWFSRNHRLG